MIEQKFDLQSIYQIIQGYKNLNKTVEIDGSKHRPSKVQEHLDSNSFFRIRDQEYVFENINEGLIVSYDIRKCKNYLKKIFPCIGNIKPFGINPYCRNKKPLTENDFVGITLNGEYEKYDEINKKLESLIGWFSSGIVIRISLDKDSQYKEFKFQKWEDGGSEKYFLIDGRLHYTIDDFIKQFYNRIIFFEMVFEAKYFERFYPEKGQKFFHVTTRSRFEKIKKQGLIPMSSSNAPERVYLGLNLSSIISMLQNKIDENDIVLEIDSGNIEMYSDPREDFCYFTYDNIPPKDINFIGKVKDFLE